MKIWVDADACPVAIKKIKDAQAIVSSELEKITDAIYEKEKPTDF